ncbi:5-formyltetrahydrofolate cyclo-ligase [uncultured Dechloromonas sp.]|uniref:5-formyltetrahydrofolate cyclo-ligase n=1 Tax=uncultured Dechloromonas sp. TaxID=171719 RepID=UPI0025CC9591|nr:5-formyltetrahydrofolate cyclo-ligase [uncultured Dechloromonas sp.]
MQEANEDNTAWRRALRRDMVARRAALSDAEHDAWSAHIVAHLQAALPLPRIVAFCWPIKHEPDVRAVIPRWAAQGVLAALPVVVREDAPLAFRLWTPDTPLAADRYGIPTPTGGEFVQPDMLLLPLNGFDGDGYRLGYGGGYFDRTLAALSPRPLAVGVGFEINRLPTIRPERHDQRLDWLVTEAGALRLPAA